MEKILIAGGFGFIGKNLIEYLYQNYKIYVIDRKIDKKFLKNYIDLSYFKFNFNNIKQLKKIINQIEPDYIINLISIVTASRDLMLFKKHIECSINVLLNLYEAAKTNKKLKLFINFGTAEEYGNIVAPYSENSREEPSSPYALVKQFTTNTSIMLFKNCKFPVSVVRPGNLFGKYQPEDKFIPNLIKKISLGEDVEITLCEQKRDFIYIKDFVFAIELLIKNYTKATGEIINISYGKGIVLKELIEYLKNKIRSQSKILYGKLPYRANEMMEFTCCIEKLKRITGIEFKYDLFSGLDNYLNICYEVKL